MTILQLGAGWDRLCDYLVFVGSREESSLRKNTYKNPNLAHVRFFHPKNDPLFTKFTKKTLRKKSTHGKFNLKTHDLPLGVLTEACQPQNLQILLPAAPRLCSSSGCQRLPFSAANYVTPFFLAVEDLFVPLQCQKTDLFLICWYVASFREFKRKRWGKMCAKHHPASQKTNRSVHIYINLQGSGCF